MFVVARKSLETAATRVRLTSTVVIVVKESCSLFVLAVAAFPGGLGDLLDGSRPQRLPRR